MTTITDRPCDFPKVEHKCLCRTCISRCYYGCFSEIVIGGRCNGHAVTSCSSYQKKLVGYEYESIRSKDGEIGYSAINRPFDLKKGDLIKARDPKSENRGNQKFDYTVEKIYPCMFSAVMKNGEKRFFNKNEYVCGEIKRKEN